MPLAFQMASRSSVPPCSLTTWCGTIWTVRGRSPTLVPVLPASGTCCSGGPEVLLFGPLPSSGAAAVCVFAFGFGGLLVRAARRAVDGVALAAGFGVVRFFG